MYLLDSGCGILKKQTLMYNKNNQNNPKQNPQKERVNWTEANIIKNKKKNNSPQSSNKSIFNTKSKNHFKKQVSLSNLDTNYYDNNYNHNNLLIMKANQSKEQLNQLHYDILSDYQNKSQNKNQEIQKNSRYFPKNNIESNFNNNNNNNNNYQSDEYTTDHNKYKKYNNNQYKKFLLKGNKKTNLTSTNNKNTYQHNQLNLNNNIPLSKSFTFQQQMIIKSKSHANITFQKKSQKEMKKIFQQYQLNNKKHKAQKISIKEAKNSNKIQAQNYNNHNNGHHNKSNNQRLKTQPNFNTPQIFQGPIYQLNATSKYNSETLSFAQKSNPGSKFQNQYFDSRKTLSNNQNIDLYKDIRKVIKYQSLNLKTEASDKNFNSQISNQHMKNNSGQEILRNTTGGALQKYHLAYLKDWQKQFKKSQAQKQSSLFKNFQKQQEIYMNFKKNKEKQMILNTGCQQNYSSTLECSPVFSYNKNFLNQQKKIIKVSSVKKIPIIKFTVSSPNDFNLNKNEFNSQENLRKIKSMEKIPEQQFQQNINQNKKNLKSFKETSNFQKFRQRFLEIFQGKIQNHVQNINMSMNINIHNNDNLNTKNKNVDESHQDIKETLKASPILSPRTKQFFSRNPKLLQFTNSQEYLYDRQNNKLLKFDGKSNSPPRLSKKISVGTPSKSNFNSITISNPNNKQKVKKDSNNLCNIQRADSFTSSPKNLEKIKISNFNKIQLVTSEDFEISQNMQSKVIPFTKIKEFQEKHKGEFTFRFVTPSSSNFNSKIDKQKGTYLLNKVQESQVTQAKQKFRPFKYKSNKTQEKYQESSCEDISQKFNDKKEENNLKEQKDIQPKIIINHSPTKSNKKFDPLTQTSQLAPIMTQSKHDFNDNDQKSMFSVDSSIVLYNAKTLSNMNNNNFKNNSKQIKSQKLIQFNNYSNYKKFDFLIPRQSQPSSSFLDPNYSDNSNGLSPPKKERKPQRKSLADVYIKQHQDQLNQKDQFINLNVVQNRNVNKKIFVQPMIQPAQDWVPFTPQYKKRKASKSNLISFKNNKRLIDLNSQKDFQQSQQDDNQYQNHNQQLQKDNQKYLSKFSNNHQFLNEQKYNQNSLFPQPKLWQMNVVQSVIDIGMQIFNKKSKLLKKN